MKSPITTDAAKAVQTTGGPAVAPAATCSVLRFEVEVDGVREIQFTALCEGKIVGRVGVMCEGRQIATIRQLYVDPNYRCRGIGMELVDKCKFEAHRAGCGTLNLAVAACNREVIPWYGSQGFWPAHVFDDGEAILALPLRKSSPNASVEQPPDSGTPPTRTTI